MLRDLLLLGRAQYRLFVDHEKKEFERILLSNRIWLDELSSSTLNRALQGVFDALLLARAHVLHAVGELA